MSTQLYLIYQVPNGEVRRKPISNRDKAEAIVKLSETKTIKIGNEAVHIVGIGTEKDFEAHKEIIGQTKYDEKPHFKQLREDVEHFKTYGKWPNRD